MNANLSSSFSALAFRNRTIFLLLSIIIVFLILDTLLIKIYPFTTAQTVLGSRLSIFVIIGTVYAIGQYFILEFIERKSTKDSDLRKNFTLIRYILLLP